MAPNIDVNFQKTYFIQKVIKIQANIKAFLNSRKFIKLVKIARKLVKLAKIVNKVHEKFMQGVFFFNYEKMFEK